MTDNAVPTREATWKVLDALNWTATFFADARALSPRLDAELLLAHVLGLQRIELYMYYDRPLGADERARYRTLVLRRANGEPVQYILGRQGFWSLDLEVGPGVLVPRPDTEVLVEEALIEAARIGCDPLRVADVGTGSGAIALALASELTHAQVWAGDRHDEPLETAAANARRTGLSERVRVVRADLLADLRQAAGAPFDLVVSNPPYIRADQMPGLMREVREWEPHTALVGGGLDGLDVIRRLVGQACDDTIRPGGALVIEVGDDEQASLLTELLNIKGFLDVRRRSDYAGNVRAVVGRWSSQ